MSFHWHILTGEFPPSTGGVGDYTAQLAAALEKAGDHVMVWTPGQTLPDRFGAQSRRVLEAALRDTPGIALLQYVPNALGARGMNVSFCLWLRALARGGTDVRVMFHEPYFYFTLARPWRNALAIAQRIMARVLLDASTVVYVSTPTWRRYLAPPGATPLEVLPIPSNIQSTATAADAEPFRCAMAPSGQPIVGHFGTYGDHVSDELNRVLPSLATRMPDARFAFVGAGSREFLSRLDATHPDIASRSWASGRLSAKDVSSALRACDVLAQPYPDGITTRRTSAMAGLEHGIATVTTSGELTEPVWTECGAVRLVPAADAPAFADAVAALVRDPAAARALGRRGADIYAARFSLERTIAILRGATVAS